MSLSGFARYQGVFGFLLKSGVKKRHFAEMAKIVFARYQGVFGFSCEFRLGDVPGVGSPCVPPLFPVLSEILAGGQQQLQDLLSIRLIWSEKTTVAGAVDTISGVPCYLS